MKPPSRVVVDAQQLAELLERLKRRELKPEDYELLEGMVDTWQFLSPGPGEEASFDQVPPADPVRPLKDQRKKANKSPPEEGEKRKRKDHGRTVAASYWGAKRVQVMHQSLKAGDWCTQCGKGKLYELKTPSPIVVFQGQAPVQATVYECRKLRCSACGAVFTAEAPEEAGAE
ncbi:MAG: hypothetical protein HWN51_07030, partial [Desulfobacterales bacterium]|nr:hypothetical protein [Desulfobacterales bacterium]